MRIDARSDSNRTDPVSIEAECSCMQLAGREFRGKQGGDPTYWREKPDDGARGFVFVWMGPSSHRTR